MNPGSTHEADFKQPKSYHIRIVHGELYEPTLLFIGDLCGPVEIATTQPLLVSIMFHARIAKPTN